MTKYAEKTTTTVDSSEREIKNTLKRYGAKEILIYTDDATNRGVVYFVLQNRHLRFNVDTPPLNHFRYDGRGRWRTEAQMRSAREQEERRRWRVLLLRLKARLEAVDDEAVPFDEEFMGNIVLPNNSTVSEAMGPKIHEAYQTGNVPDLIDEMVRPRALLPPPVER